VGGLVEGWLVACRLPLDEISGVCSNRFTLAESLGGERGHGRALPAQGEAKVRADQSDECFGTYSEILTLCDALL